MTIKCHLEPCEYARTSGAWIRGLRVSHEVKGRMPIRSERVPTADSIRATDNGFVWRGRIGSD